MCYFIGICMIVYFYAGLGACLLPRKLGLYFSLKESILIFFLWWIVPIRLLWEITARRKKLLNRTTRAG